jgi:hypothetical protein
MMRGRYSNGRAAQSSGLPAQINNAAKKIKIKSFSSRTAIEGDNIPAMA